jgi:hypothetical protein
MLHSGSGQFQKPPARTNTMKHRDTRQLLTASDPLQRRRSIMVEFMLTIIGFAGAMTAPAFLTAILESTASKIRPAPVRAASPGGRR